MEAALQKEAVPDRSLHTEASPDFLRQLAILDPQQFQHTVHIVGVGAIGSHVADTLTCLGLRAIKLYDDDKVEPHNLPNQCFRIRDVGHWKVDAMRDLVKEKMGFEVEAIQGKVERFDPETSGIVVLCVDSMAARKEIVQSVRNNRKVPMVIETRMGIEEGRIYCFDPNNRIHFTKWMGDWYPDEAAEASPCTSRAISTTSKTLSGFAAHQVVLYHQQQQGKTTLPRFHKIHLGTNGQTKIENWD